MTGCINLWVKYGSDVYEHYRPSARYSSLCFWGRHVLKAANIFHSYSCSPETEFNEHLLCVDYFSIIHMHDFNPAKKMEAKID